MNSRRFSRWAAAVLLAGCLSATGGALAQTAAVAPRDPQVVLVQQPSTQPATNTDASSLPSINSQAADDFVVPNNVFWRIATVSAVGGDDGSSGSGVDRLLVQFYTNSGSNLPSTPIYANTFPSGSFTENNGTFVANKNYFVGYS